MNNGDDELFVQPTDPGQLYDGQNLITEKEAQQQVEQEAKVEVSEVKSVNVEGSKAVTTSLVLPFQQKIIRDMLEEDGLLIMARGMGLLQVTVNLIHALDVVGIDTRPKKAGESQENSLILVVGAADDDNDKIRVGLRDLASLDGLNGEETPVEAPLDRGLTVFSETDTRTRRQSAYAQGGVFSMSSVVVIADMLTDTIDRRKITGIVVLNAHRVKEDSGVAFLLSLYRDVNKAGFIKALSDQPERFSTGFSSLSKHLKWIKVRRLWLWPRFHVKVRNVLENSERDVVEIAVWPSDSMIEIGKDLRAIMESCLSELRQLSVVKQNVENANENWTLDNAILRNFMGMVRGALGPVWHQMKGKNRQLIYDIGEILQLLERSTTASSVSFLTDLTCMHRLARIALLKGMTSWIEHPAAELLLKAARERVFGKGGVEEPPKWDQLGKILDEIALAQQQTHSHGDIPPGPILIMCSSFSGELKSVVTRLKKKDGDIYSAQEFLIKQRQAFNFWQKHLVNVQSLYHSGMTMNQVKAVANMPREATRQNQQQQQQQAQRGFNKRRRVRGGSTMQVGGRDSQQPQQQPPVPDSEGTEDSLVPEEIEILDDDDDEDDETFEPLDDTIQVMDMSDVVIVDTYNESANETLLQELQPSYIILYEPDLAFVRRVEEYRFTHKAKVYFMYYKDSVEEQRYLAAVRREKDTFTTLIREKAKIPIILEDESGEYSSQAPAILRAVSSRIAGGQEIISEKPRVIVDTRELKSSLPYQIYKHSCEVVPVTLTVGDYVLTPDICVERKSISDLVQSLNSGRLYKQCVEMCKYYDLPTLLVEFDEAKSFSSLSMDESERLKNSEMERLLQESVQSKLTLLILTFQKLRTIWSSSPFQTAEIFMELKQSRKEPDVETSLSHGRRSANAKVENDEAIAMLQSIPGITHQNYRAIIDNVRDLKEFCRMSEPELGGLIGKQAARKVNEFLRKQSIN